MLHTFAFDEAGLQIGMRDLSGITSYIYDNVGRQKGVINGFGQAFTDTYNTVGNRTNMLDSLNANTLYPMTSGAAPPVSPTRRGKPLQSLTTPSVGN